MYSTTSMYSKNLVFENLRINLNKDSFYESIQEFKNHLRIKSIEESENRIAQIIFI